MIACWHEFGNSVYNAPGSPILCQNGNGHGISYVITLVITYAPRLGDGIPSPLRRCDLLLAWDGCAGVYCGAAPCLRVCHGSHTACPCVGSCLRHCLALLRCYLDAACPFARTICSYLLAGNWCGSPAPFLGSLSSPYLSLLSIYSRPLSSLFTSYSTSHCFSDSVPIAPSTPD